jgi:hypothetical protein
VLKGKYALRDFPGYFRIDDVQHTQLIKYLKQNLPYILAYKQEFLGIFCNELGGTSN